MKKAGHLLHPVFILLAAFCFPDQAVGQAGLEGVIIEQYYISDANDSGTPFFPVPSGAVTYRIFVDMAPNWGLQAVYAATNSTTGQIDTLVIRSTQPFFNNEDRGRTFGYLIPTTSLDENTVSLDSWFSTGRTGNNSLGLLKPEDTSAGAPSFPNLDGLLQNDDPDAGFPISEADGSIAGISTLVWTPVGNISVPLTIFDDLNLAGNEFVVTDGALTNFASPIQGPNPTNKVLIGQFTTAGDFSGQLNLQIRNSTTGEIQQWVAESPEPGQFTSPQLKWKNNSPPVVSILSPTEGTRFLSGETVIVTADAMDPDSAIHEVEFFFNGVSFGIDNAFPFEATFTATVNGLITAVATGDLGDQTPSAPVFIEVIPYRVGDMVSDCNLPTSCQPVEVFGQGISDITGFDLVLNFDLDKIAPTGVIFNSPALIDTDFFDTDLVMDLIHQEISIHVFLNPNAPPGSSFSGTGDLLCVEFLKRPGFMVGDTTILWISSMQATYAGGGILSYDSIPAGTLINTSHTAFFGSLSFWADQFPMVYDTAHPSAYVPTRISGKTDDCDTLNPIQLLPDLNGAFVHQLGNGYSLTFDRDIASGTDVQSVINSFDAFLVRKVLKEDPDFIPDVFQFIAMDVNRDGVVSAGDVSQINQRSVLHHDEFRQAWNYNGDGTPQAGSTPSKDWLFVSRSTRLFDPAYQRSTTYPGDNGSGFSRHRVPLPPFCIWTGVDDQPGVCPEQRVETYYGVLLGDVNGNYRFIENDGVLK